MKIFLLSFLLFSIFSLNSQEFKPIPDPWEYDVVPPDMNYRYFELAEQFPFEKDNSEYSPVNAWWLSEASFLAYCHPGFSRMAYELAGLDHFESFHTSEIDCTVAWNEDLCIVAFRGTELKSFSALGELLTDITTVPVSYELGGRVHLGFYSGFEDIWEGSAKLKNFLQARIIEKPERAMWITGHSLGGALASFCFTRLPAAAGLYTFGAPRVGTREFADLMKGRPVFRVVHGEDPVADLPPDLPITEGGFKHAGELIFITPEGEVIREGADVSSTPSDSQRESRLSRIYKRIKTDEKEDAKRWLAGLRILREETVPALNDHMAIYYSVKLYNRLLIGDSPY